MKRHLKLFLLSIVILFNTPLFAIDTLSIPYLDDDIQIQHYHSEADQLLIIFPSDHGLTDGLKNLANNINKAGVEVWLVDPFTTWFLPEAESSLNKIPTQAYARVIQAAHKTNKKIFLMSNDKGVKNLLEAAHAWQENYSGLLSGVILISPNIYKKTPQGGREGKLLPIAKASNLPVYIFVAEKSTLSLRSPTTVNALEKGGSDVFVQYLKNVRNRFFFRPDADNAEKSLTQNFANKIKQAMQLSQLYAKQRSAVALKELNSNNDTKKTTGSLRPYNGSLSAKDFQRMDINGQAHSLSENKGKVIIVNFWASWCPPCVHEMPSMAQLNKSFSDKPFTILAINLGESKQEINIFLKDHPVNFPVLLDETKSLPKKWKVFAFPTSYLIDKTGAIKYSVAGGIDWNSNQVKEVIKNLF